jgi:hypothetical protein
LLSRLTIARADTSQACDAPWRRTPRAVCSPLMLVVAMQDLIRGTQRKLSKASPSFAKIM